MADWTGAGRDTPEVYRFMAANDLDGVSPTYAALCRAVATDAELCARLDLLPSPKRQPNLLLAAVRYLAGPVDRPPDFLRFVHRRWEDVAEVITSHRVQTNEAGRCASVLPVLAALPQPLALLEVGASAGLCLLLDRYAYRYTDSDGGVRTVGDGPIVLECATDTHVPVPTRVPAVAWRAGLDLSPVDVTRTEDRRWLESLVWPEQRERARRLAAALALAASDPPLVLAGDAVTDLPALAARAPDDATLVIFHSATLAYLTPPGRHRFAAVVDELRRSRRTVHWVSNEIVGAVSGTDLDDVPSGHFVVALDQQPVATAAPRGGSLAWLADGQR